MKTAKPALSRRMMLAALASPALGLGTHARAQAWPNKPITMIVPFSPGGPTDLGARTLAQKLGENIGQAVVVENRPGANGNIGNLAVARAPADGYTILYNTSSMTVSPALYKDMQYNVEKDFAPVALTTVVPMALLVPQSVPANTVGEFIAWARANPGKLAYGSAGNGSVTHLGMFQFVQAAGIDAVHVPFKGTAPAAVALLAGQTQFMFDTVNTTMAFVRDKRLKMLAMTTARRVPLFPDVPTLAEAGVPGFELGIWQGVMAPAATPRPLVDRLNAAILKSLQDPQLKAKLAAQGAEPLGSTPAEYAAYVKKELTRWAAVVKASGVSVE